jgi:hypothetical protein
MPYPDGTPTTDEHVAEALNLIVRASRPYPVVGEVAPIIEAINGLTHAVLALVSNQETRRAEGRGW